MSTGKVGFRNPFGTDMFGPHTSLVRICHLLFPRRYPLRWATIIGELHVMTQATRHTGAAPPGNPKAALLEPGMVVRLRSPTYLVESVDTWTATSATGSMTVPTAILVSSTNVHTISG